MDTAGDNYQRWFIPGRVVDGDTITADSVDLGYLRYVREENDPIRYRLLGVNCPESNRPESRAAGLAAKEFTKAWIAEHLTHGDGTSLVAHTVKADGHKLTDSFGRFLADILCADGHSLATDLLTSGHAVPFKG